MGSIPILAPDAILPPEPELPAGPPAVRPRATPVAVRRVRPRDLYRALLDDALSVNTRMARERDARALAKFLGAASPAEACAAIILADNGRPARDAGRANALGLAFRKHLADRGLAPASINRHLAHVRKVATLARRFGLIVWVCEIEDFPVVAYRDTRGPGLDGWRALWAAAVAAGVRPIARRDRAILRLLHDHGLRRGEVVSLDLADFDGHRLWVRGKGRFDREAISLNDQSARAIRDWLESRGDHPGPMFVSCGVLYRYNKAAWTKRLDGATISNMVRGLSTRAGLARPARPHGIRHQAITRALDLTNGNVRKVQKFARHAKPETTLRYDDQREDLAGEVSKLLGADDD